MATVKIKTLHRAVDRVVDYVIDWNKTRNQELVSSFACSKTCPEIDFDNAKWEYQRSQGVQTTSQGKKEVLARHLFQSFDPINDNVSPEKANEIGMEFANRIFGNDYQYIVATHIDRGHIHNHIIVNAYSFTGEKKFNRPQFQTWKEFSEISDTLCQEYGLSVLAPTSNKEIYSQSFNEYQARKHGFSWKAKIEGIIDDAISDSKTYSEFIEKIQLMGLEVDNINEWGTTEEGKKTHQKYIKFRLEGQEYWTRGSVKNFGDGYTREDIQDRINGTFVKELQPKTIDENDKWAKYKGNVQVAVDKMSTLTATTRFIENQNIKNITDINTKIKNHENIIENIELEMAGNKNQTKDIKELLNDFKTVENLSPLIAEFNSLPDESKPIFQAKHDSQFRDFNKAVDRIKEKNCESITSLNQAFDIIAFNKDALDEMKINLSEEKNFKQELEKAKEVILKISDDKKSKEDIQKDKHSEDTRNDNLHKKKPIKEPER